MTQEADPPAPDAVDASDLPPRVAAFNRMTAQALRDVPAVYTRPLSVVRAERAAWARRATGGGVGWMERIERDFDYWKYCATELDFSN